MISKNTEPTVKSGQRQLMQYLRSGNWKIAAKLPVAASPGTLDRLAEYGWIDRRDQGTQVEIKLTPVGQLAPRTPSDLRKSIPFRGACLSRCLLNCRTLTQGSPLARVCHFGLVWVAVGSV